MKKILFTLQIALLVIYTCTAQQKSGLIKNYQSQKTDTDSKMYPIPGSHILNKFWKEDLAKLRANKKSNTSELALRKMNKPPWNFSVGQAYEWWATNMTDPNALIEYKVPSTCRAVGNNCYIFVEDQLWTSRVNQAAVDTMIAAWEERTPANASKGIYQLDVEYFGNPPDVDDDPKIIILILDIKDGYTSGGYVAGYFYSINEFTEQEVQHELGSDRHSNHAEIYYIDANPADLRTSGGVTAASSTTAHEFQHMIFFNYDDIGKETFINEGMSEIASKLCGYALDGPAEYYSNTNVDFFSWGETGDIFEDYSRAATFSWYLIEQFETGVAKYIVKNQYDGPECYTSAFDSAGSDLRFTDVLKDFALAAQINNTAYDPRYGFTIPISIKPSAVTHIIPIVPSTEDFVMPYGTRYIEFVSGQSISIDINYTTGYTGNIEVKAIATGTAGIKLDNITLGATYTLSDFGTNYSNLVLAVTNLTDSKTYFTYSATGSGGSGSVELKYDLTEPTGYLQGVGDTVCVWFNGVAGGKIDSIRVALRRAGSMSGGIWEYTGDLRPTPIGNKLASITATLPINYVPEPPYPIPWPNWATINLTSSSIDASKAFAVAFVNQGNDLTQPRVMVTESPLPSELTSFTYIAEDGEWYYQPSNYSGDSVYTYLIRAYVSVPTSVDNPDVLQMPVSYVLHQNYPNPFNPKTVISYNLKERSEVGLRIYDVLGREIVTLVNEVKDAGYYTVEWDGRNSAGLQMSSGVYFYQLKCENGFVDTKKMVLMK
ncbi:MAG: T9SS type A sorting domain-containing protein [Bacteroidetes bacterium]|nr:T9SS type A sorting domain-containing protein [Bacteroidota bacterium]